MELEGQGTSGLETLPTSIKPSSRPFSMHLAVQFIVLTNLILALSLPSWDRFEMPEASYGKIAMTSLDNAGPPVPVEVHNAV